MRALHAVVSVIAVSLLVPLLATPSATAAPMWTPAERLGTEGTFVDVAVNAAGDAVAVWSTGRFIKASYRPAGQDWKGPEKVALGHSDGDPIVVIDRQGDATVVWTDGEMHLADRMPDGTWNSVKDARLNDQHGDSCGDAYAGWPVLAGDPAGNIVVTWYETACEGYDTWEHFVWRSKTGAWGPIRDGGGGNFMTAVTITPDGVATFVKAASGVWAQTTRMGGELSPIKILVDGGDHWYPDIASNARGDIVVATVSRSLPDSPKQSVALSKAAGEPWQPAHQTPFATDMSGPSVAINNDGTTAVAYVRESSGTRVVASLGTVAGNQWSEPTAVSGSLRFPSTPDIAVAPDGAAAVVWATVPTNVPINTQASYRAPGQAWGGPVTLAGQRTDGFPGWWGPLPKVVAYPNGMFTSVFVRNAPLFSDHVDDTVAPMTRMVAPRTDFVRSTRIPVRWRSSDELARVRDMDVRVRSAGRSGDFSTWSAWRRRTADTSAVFAAKPGRTYCFSARARDRVGNLGAWAGERCAATPIDDRALNASSGWDRVKDRSAFLGTLTSAESAGDRVSLQNVRAKTLRLVVRTCPGCGTVRVFHGGRDLGKFSLYSPRVHNKRVILLREYSRVRGGTVVVRAVSSRKPVQIDGVVATR